MSQTKAQLIDPVDGSLVNADINASAAIAGTKISPDFGSQNIATTGTLASGDVTLTSTQPKIIFNDSNNNPDYQIENVQGVFKIRDNTNSADRLVVNTDGHIDIGGNVDFGAGIDVTGAITGTGDMTIDTNTLHVDSSNNRVGIGTTSPTGILEIDSSSSTSQIMLDVSGTNYARIGHNTSGGSPLLDIRSEGHARILANGNNTAVFVKSDLNVGIGTTTPSQKLDVNGSGLIQGTLQVNDRLQLVETAPELLFSSPSGGLDSRILNDGSGNLIIGHGVNSDTPTERLRMNSDGQIGIGVTPATVLHVKANVGDMLRLDRDNSGAVGNQIAFRHKDASDNFVETCSINAVASSNAADGNLRFNTKTSGGSNTEKLRITEAGNVGIGTTNPSTELHVKDASADCIVRVESESGYDARLQLDTSNGGGAVAHLDFLMDGTNKGGIEYVNNASSASVNCMIFRTTDLSERLRIDASGDITAAKSIVSANLPGRNFLINGAMQINQRRASPNLTYYNPVTSSIYTLDRWKVVIGSGFDTDSAHIHQSTQTPDGFSSSMKWEIGNTETPSANQNCGIEQKIEGLNLQGLGYGTSSAKTMTLSFHVRSNKTGTYCVQIMQEDGTKYQMHEYTISSSNTWEKKTITIVGNTANAINNDSSVGLRVIWMLTVGSGDHVAASSTWVSGGDLAATSNQVNLWDNVNNEWYLTGCQLEVGTIATEFEHIDRADELARCQRYFIQYDRGLNNTNDDGNTPVLCNVIAGDGNDTFGPLFLPVCMRAAPTVSVSSADHFQTSRVFSGTQTVGGSISIAYSSVAPHQVIYIRANHNPSPSFSSGEAYNLRFRNQQAGILELDAEL